VTPWEIDTVLCPRRPLVRYAVSLELVNLDEVERDLVNTLVAVLTDPALAAARQSLREGRIVLAIEHGEVIWTEPKEAA
jgi:hypothetical protein